MGILTVRTTTRIRLAKSTPKADFSNVQGGSSSTAQKPVSIPSPTGTSGTSGGKTYTVAAGDSLSKIAKREYGDGNAWNRIYEANRDIIKNPDLIYPGQTLKIPAKSWACARRASLRAPERASDSRAAASERSESRRGAGGWGPGTID